MSGLKQIQALQDGGFSEDVIQNHVQERSDALLQGGFKQEEVNNYFGYKKPNTKKIEQFWTDGMQDIISPEDLQLFNDNNTNDIEAEKIDKKLTERLWGKDFNLGPLVRKKLGDSTVNTMLNVHAGRGMEMNLPEPDDIGFVEKLIGEGVGMAAELPIYAGGYAYGMYKTKNPYAALFVSGLTGGTIREMYSEMRQNGEVKNYSEFWDLFLNKGLSAGIKEGISLYAGGVSTKFLGPLKNSVLANTLAFNTALTTSSVILGDEVPDAENFLIQNILSLPIGYTLAKQNIRDTVNKTGKHQSEIYEDMIKDRTIAEDAASINIKPFRAYKDIIKKEVQPSKEIIIDPKKLKDKEQNLINEIQDIKQQISEGAIFGKDFLTRKQIELENVSKSIKNKTSKLTKDKISKTEKEIIIDPKKPKDKDALKIEETIDRKPIKQPFNYKQLKDDFLYYGIDNYNVFKQVTDKAKKLNFNFDKVVDPYEGMIIQQGLKGVAEHNIHYGTLDSFKNSYEIIGKSLKERVGKTKDGKNMDQYLNSIDHALKSARSVELNKRNIESGVPLQSAKNFIKKNPDLMTRQKDIVDYQKIQLKNFKDEGMLTEDGYKAMIKANQDYVTFARVIEPGKSSKQFGGEGIVNPLRRIKGAKLKTYSPLASVVNNTYLFRAISERNMAHSNIIDLIFKIKKAEPGSFPEVYEVPARTKATRVTRQELEKAGIIEKSAKLPDDVADAFSIFRKEQGALKSTEIQISKNGVRKVYEVGDNFARGFKNIEKTVWDDITRVIGVPTRLLRAGATQLNPEFMYNNLPRDAFTSAILSKTWHPPFYGMLNGVGMYIKPLRTKLGYQPVFQQYVKSGGFRSAMVSMDRNYFQAGYKEIFTGLKFLNVIKNPVEMIRVVAEASETVGRMGTFKLSLQRYLKLGVPLKEAIRKAGFDSKINPVDYGRSGIAARQANLISAFFTARIGALTSLVEAFKQRPFQTTAKSIGYITTLSIYNWFQNHDDPDYARLPQWRKDLSWNFKVTNSTITDALGFEKGYFYFPVPKPFELGLIFGTGAERFLDYYYDNDPDAINDIKNKIIKDTAMSLVPIPDIGKPFFEAWSNKSLFTGQPIIPNSIKNLPTEYQVTNYTSETSKQIGNLIRKINEDDFSSISSPVQIDNAIRSITGPLGRVLTQSIDKILLEGGLIEDPILPDKRLVEQPFFKVLAVRDPDRNAAPIQEFYDEYNKIRKRQSAIKKFQDAGQYDLAEKETKKLPPNYIDLEMTYNAIRIKEDGIRKIFNTKKGYSGEEKAFFIRKFTDQMIDEAIRGLKRFKEIR